MNYQSLTHNESHSNMKNVNGRARTKPSPILVLDYGFDYKLQTCGQISFGTENFSAQVSIFFSLEMISLCSPTFRHIQFWQMSEGLYKTMNLTNHSLL